MKHTSGQGLISLLLWLLSSALPFAALAGTEIPMPSKEATMGEEHSAVGKKPSAISKEPSVMGEKFQL
ncbi:hypothetical protein ACWAU3_00835 [Shewanella sp. JL219SE-S6]